MGENVEHTNLMDTNSEVGIIADKGGAGDLTCRKGHKHRLSDRKNGVTLTSKIKVGLG